MRLLITACLLMTLVGSVFALSDPTRPSDYSGPAPGGVGKNGFHIGAILHSHHRKVAVINGQAYSVGDQVLGTKILQINKDSVLFRNAEGDFSVRLGELHNQASSKSSISIEQSGAKL
jgi:MSHA biogenesis protein MshK